MPASLAIRPRAERVEFISTIWVESGIRVYCLPKPVKTVTGSIISFAVASDIRTAAYTKMTSVMDNCVHCPLLFEFFSMQARFWSDKGGDFDTAALDPFKREQLADRRIADIRSAHDRFLTEDGAAVAVRSAFAMETGISVDSQILMETAYKSADPAAIPDHSRRLYSLLGMVHTDA